MAIYNYGTMAAFDCTFVSTPSSTVYLDAASTTRLSNCTFATHTSSTAGHDHFIYTSGAHVDYGNCTPGRTPGTSGTAILVSDGSFTGCPFVCPLGTWGRGGPTAALQAIQTGCGLGCETCPAGAVCDATALPAPNYCPVGHYNPDRGSQMAGGCRECERCGCTCETPLPNKLNTPSQQTQRYTRACAQWVFPSGDCFPPVHPVPSRHLLSDQGQHCLPALRSGRLLRGGGCQLCLRLPAVPARHLVEHCRPQQQ